MIPVELPLTYDDWAKLINYEYPAKHDHPAFAWVFNNADPPYSFAFYHRGIPVDGPYDLLFELMDDCSLIFEFSNIKDAVLFKLIWG